MSDLFFYGTLCDAEVLRIVLGRPDARLEPARLADHAVFWSGEENFPMIVAAPGQNADGMLCRDVTGTERARLAFYEAGFAFATETLAVDLETGSVPALVFFPVEGNWTPGRPWDLADWQCRWGPMARRAAVEFMEYFGAPDQDAADGRFPMMQARAHSRALARAQPAPRSSTAPDPHRVEQVWRRVPYRGFFRLEEHRLSVPRFDGKAAGTIDRTVFFGCDAVTVLPYDPKTDRVLVIEQFRIGPFAREDQSPWLLEAPAGRVDPGEDYAVAARREMVEETGLAVNALREIGRYYPSPGMVTEMLVSYIGTADLPDPGTWTGGKTDENEDICSHVMTFDDLCELEIRGHLRNGPLLLSLGWLKLHRGDVRAG